METKESVQFVRTCQRHGGQNKWFIENPILSEGEIGIDSDVHFMKIGDDTTSWKDLPYTKGTGLAYCLGKEEATQQYYSLDEQLRGTLSCVTNKNGACNIYMYVNVTENGVTHCARMPLNFFYQIKNSAVKKNG